MPVILLSHKVADFDKWLAAFNAHLPMRQTSGLGGEKVFTSADNPNLVHVMLTVKDMEHAQSFIQNPDLKQAMQDAGVLEAPKLTMLGDEHASAQSLAG